MRVLFIGGTGLIGGACTDLALARGLDVTHLNRGARREPPPGVTTLIADVRDEGAAAAALGILDFDAVVDFIAYRPDDIERDLRLFGGRTSHLVVVSSATVYAKPHAALPVREDWPLGNAFWAYARDKQACEERLLRAVREDRIAGTIVRPSHTYGDGSIPLAVRSLAHPYTTVARMRAGRPVILPGDGTSLWTLTHATDAAVGIVGLLGQVSAAGHAFNLTSDEALPWEAIHRQVAAAAGAELHPVHLPSAFIAEVFPDLAGRLLGDASISSAFDSGKLARWVPDFRPAVRFADGIRRSMAWFDADAARRTVDAELEARWDAAIEAWEHGLDAARAHLRGPA
jgi:nucleoside-diphosphate-sugar epimerase